MKKQILLTGGVIGLVLTLGVWTYTRAVGEEIRACASKSGALQLIGSGFKNSKCDKNEKLVTWNKEGVQGQKGDQGAQGVKGDKGEKGDKGQPGTGGSQLHLVDGNGQDLGILLDGAGTGFRTFVPSVGRIVELKAAFGQIEFLNSQPLISYENSNCTGSAFVQTHPGSPQNGPFYSTGNGHLSILRVVFENSTVKYYRIVNESGGNRTRASFRNSSCVDIGSVNFQPPLETVVFSYLVEEVSLPFSEPLAWPLTVVSH